MLPLGFFGIRFTFVKEKVELDPELSKQILTDAKRSSRAPDAQGNTYESSVNPLIDAMVPNDLNDKERLSKLQEATKDK